VRVTPNSYPAGNHVWITNDSFRTGYRSGKCRTATGSTSTRSTTALSTEPVVRKGCRRHPSIRALSSAKHVSKGATQDAKLARGRFCASGRTIPPTTVKPPEALPYWFIRQQRTWRMHHLPG
jgi:hypothetical protein